jgi:bifunctional N-acetylglucosamine-1-phosphate-uridyltransferase/glucosamine-1-phosphate-acetyltransferase GlmU-like protein
MLDRVFDLYAPWVDQFVIVISPESGGAIVQHCRGLPFRIAFAEQRTPTGMLDAILLARDVVAASRAEVVWITWVDQVAVHPRTLAALARTSEDRTVAMALPTIVRQDPYTLLERDSSGTIVRVRYRRERDEMPARGESELGLFSLAREIYLGELQTFADEDDRTGAATGERNFLPFIPWLAARRRVVTVAATEDVEAIGVNTPEELAIVETALRQRRETT